MATCRLTAKNRDQLRDPTLGNRVWATFTLFTVWDRRKEAYTPKTSSICTVVSIHFRLVADRQTDGQTQKALPRLQALRSIAR